MVRKSVREEVKRWHGGVRKVKQRCGDFGVSTGEEVPTKAPKPSAKGREEGLVIVPQAAGAAVNGVSQEASLLALSRCQLNEKARGTVHGVIEPRMVVPKGMGSAVQEVQFSARTGLPVPTLKIN